MELLIVLVVVRMFCTVCTLTPAAAPRPAKGAPRAASATLAGLCGAGATAATWEAASCGTDSAIACAAAAAAELGGGAPCRCTSTATLSATRSHSTLSSNAFAVNSKYSRDPSLRAPARTQQEHITYCTHGGWTWARLGDAHGQAVGLGAHMMPSQPDGLYPASSMSGSHGLRCSCTYVPSSRQFALPCTR